MFEWLQVILLTGSALWQFSSAAPADPTITTAAVLPRQNSDNFIGYLDLNNTWSSFNLTSILQHPSTANTGPTPPAEVTSGSKAWIAGAVAGPILGLALVGLGIWFFLRRKKKAALVPQYGTASMAPIDPSQPPAGVGGYTDAKPQFATSQPGYYSPPGQSDHYVQQGSPQQGGYSVSSQYGFQSGHNSTATSPPLGSYTDDARTAELSGEDVITHDEGSSDGKRLSKEGHSKPQ
ncbi:hypothetical protein N0V95_004374 [Ascochyta clinopodiicola]|nr:hypothetical protein N0V95_004374 [Ascochyta clinopodiicola]